MFASTPHELTYYAVKIWGVLSRLVWQCGNGGVKSYVVLQVAPSSAMVSASSPILFLPFQGNYSTVLNLQKFPASTANKTHLKSQNCLQVTNL
jgi:hypothetical protein